MVYTKTRRRKIKRNLHATATPFRWLNQTQRLGSFSFEEKQKRMERAHFPHAWNLKPDFSFFNTAKGEDKNKNKTKKHLTHKKIRKGKPNNVGKTTKKFQHQFRFDLMEWWTGSLSKSSVFVFVYVQFVFTHTYPKVLLTVSRSNKRARLPVFFSSPYTFEFIFQEYI
jgi:hypothetical protein